MLLGRSGPPPRPAPAGRSCSCCATRLAAAASHCRNRSAPRWPTDATAALISTLTTAAARRASRAVSDPVPVPTSSTTSRRSSSAASTRKLHEIQVDQEILPVPRVGPDARRPGTAATERIPSGDESSCGVPALGVRSPSPFLERSGQRVSVPRSCCSTYLANTSVSRFTGSPTCSGPSVVTFERVRNQGHAESLGFHIHQRQAHAVNGDRALAGHLPRQ